MDALSNAFILSFYDIYTARTSITMVNVVRACSDMSYLCLYLLSSGLVWYKYPGAQPSTRSQSLTYYTYELLDLRFIDKHPTIGPDRTTDPSKLLDCKINVDTGRGVTDSVVYE